MWDPKDAGERLRNLLGGGSKSAENDATPGGNTGKNTSLEGELPPNLQNWVDKMASQSEDVSEEDVIQGEAFEEFASGYGFDVEGFRERFLE